MCGGGPLFEDASEANAGQSDGALLTSDVVDPLILCAIREVRNQKDQTRRDYHSLRSYIDNYRTRADNLESQVREWCDELEDSAIQRERTVSSYMRKYNHLETGQDALLKWIRALEHKLENREMTSSCSGTCRYQVDALSRRMETMEKQMQALENNCNKNINSLSLKFNSLQKQTSENTQTIRKALSQASPTTKPGTMEARLTNMAHTVDLHGHYFSEVRDRIMQQETTMMHNQELVDSLPKSKDLEDHIEEAVIRIHARTINQSISEIYQSQEQRTASLEDRISRQALENEERFESLAKADKRFRSKLFESRKHADSSFADLKSSLEGQIAAHQETVEVHNKSLIDSFNETLFNFATALQDDHLSGMNTSISQQAGQLEQLQNQYIDVEAHLHRQMAAKPNSIASTTVAGPARPVAPELQTTSVPA